jgi:hypothetical protein
MFGFNVEQVGSAVRSVIIFGGGFVVAKGWFSAEEVALFGGAAGAFAAALYGIIIKRKAAKAS